MCCGGKEKKKERKRIKIENIILLKLLYVLYEYNTIRTDTIQYSTNVGRLGNFFRTFGRWENDDGKFARGGRKKGGVVGISGEGERKGRK